MKCDVSRLLRVVLLSVCLFGTGTAWAQQSGEKAATPGSGRTGIAWEQLSGEQQQVLSSAQSTWSQLPPGRQIALANGAKRFIAMDTAQRGAANQRFADWRQLSDRERVEIGERFRLFGGLSAREKQRLRQTARRFDRMNQEQRDQMRERFQQLTPEQRTRLREQMRERQLPQRRK